MSPKGCPLFSRLFRGLTLVFVLLGPPLEAHEVPASQVLLDIGVSSVSVEMRLPAGELRAALGLPGDTGATDLSTTHTELVAQYIGAHCSLTTNEGHFYLRGKIELSTNPMQDTEWVTARIVFTAPRSASTQAFVVTDDVIVANVVTHNIFVSVRSDFRNGIFDDGTTEHPLLGLLHYQQKQLKVESREGGWIHGATDVFTLGMNHIAEGTDHLLFLLALLLVAPLRANHRHWNQDPGMGSSVARVLKTVTGFTLGHSLTLLLGATGMIRFPGQPVEVLIAFSVLISAAHAIRPVFPGKEPWVAAFFGLVHGMAFATSLAVFAYDPYVLGLAVIGFNFGIEAMQLGIVLLVLPALLLLAGTPWYRSVRIGAALFAGLLALAWLWERAFHAVNPLHPLSNSLSDHALSVIAALTLLGLAGRALRWWQTSTPRPRPRPPSA